MNKLFGFMKALLSDDDVKYRKNPNPTGTLTPERQFAISLAAPNSEQTESFIDSLTTGKDKEELVDNLASYWGIEDRETAIEAITDCAEGGHRRYFPVIYPTIQLPKKMWEKTLRENLPDADEETLERLLSYCENLKESVDSLVKDKDIAPEDVKRGIAAWDYGRAVNLYRFAYDVGYITEAEAWGGIDQLATQARKDFTNWRDYAWSFFLGRCMWRGMSDMGWSGMFWICKNLLTDEESPWVQHPWDAGRH